MLEEKTARLPAPMPPGRVRLRRWSDQDREPFAALNADPEVMEYFPDLLSRAESDAFIDRTDEALDSAGYGLWAVEVAATGEFVGFAGLARPGFDAPFMPAVEIGWRFARPAWGHGYASEAARAVLAFAFDELDLDEVVSFTAETNRRSRAVMGRLGMTRNEDDDFDHPNVAAGSSLRRHVLYRMSARRWRVVAQFVDQLTAGAGDVDARRAVFHAVRELPYVTNAAATAEDLLRWRRGNCAAKADLFAQALRYLGYDARRVYWRYLLPEEPAQVRLLPSRTDVHCAVEVRLGDTWTFVDPTLDPALAQHGLRVADWDGHGATVPAFAPSGPIWREGRDDVLIASARDETARAVGAGDDPQRYLVAFNRWLESVRR